jgi:galactofuranosylgalactofuranosylrhamnosyl-N-acetylglucosaminyl-diphospho-decaprenol beta-1,5/1,6-galactofuranosyltransferase
VTYRKRDPKLFWSMLRKAAQNHAILAKEFPRLAVEYRRAKAELTSIESWRKVFEG